MPRARVFGGLTGRRAFRLLMLSDLFIPECSYQSWLGLLLFFFLRNTVCYAKKKSRGLYILEVTQSENELSEISRISPNSRGASITEQDTRKRIPGTPPAFAHSRSQQVSTALSSQHSRMKSSAVLCHTLCIIRLYYIHQPPRLLAP